MGGISVNALLEMVHLAFNIRLCDRKITQVKASKPCLNYHIKKCLAPCANLISKEEYRQRVLDAISFLSGDTALLEQLLTEKMFTASQNEDFELALKYKENLVSLEKLKQKRITALNKFLNADIISYQSNGIYSAVNLLIIRGGRMLGGKNFAFESVAIDKSEALREFTLRYYTQNTEIPDEIVFEEQPLDQDLLTQYFKDNFSKAPIILVAKQGVRKQLLEMASVNAKEYLETNIDKIKHKEDMTIVACKALQEKLGLKNYPRRMECYDISNVSGVDKVGSMVVFINGVKDSQSYRRFKIKTVEGADDYKSHQEMMQRRLERLSTDSERFPKPDLVVIDGGKGQLSSVKEIFDKFAVKDIDLIALAEKEEEIFTLNSQSSIKLDKSDYCLRLLQRLRDEAHRFAITYHRTLRGKRALSSVLDGVKGLGKVKKQALLNEFKDISGIVLATKEQLKKVEGIGEKQAQNIIDVLTKEGLK